MNLLRKALPILLLATLFLLQGCGTTHKRIEHTKQQVDQEALIQKRLAAQIKSERKSRVSKISSRLSKATYGVCRELSDNRKTNCSVPVKVVEARDINAYADGKTAYINTGMIDFSSNDEELAVIIAHEMAHNILMHGDKKKTNGLIGEIIGAGVQVATGVDARQLFHDLGRLTYSQAFESEADYVGLYLVARAGYDYSKSPNLWRKMGMENSQNINVGLLASHPGSSERYLALDAAVLEIQEKLKYGLDILPDKLGKDTVSEHVAINGDIALSPEERQTLKPASISGGTYAPPKGKDYGKWSVVAQDTALSLDCKNQDGYRAPSTLISTKYGTENISLACNDGRNLVMVCKYSNCSLKQ